MNTTLTRRRFVKTLVVGAAGASVSPALAQGGESEAFSFMLLGDLHFDKLEHHDMEWLQREKPDDVHQVQTYSRLTREILPSLFRTVQVTIAELNRSPETRPAFALHVGDLVEGLCGNERLAVKQNSEAIEFIRGARLGVPFLFTKGNHDITGPAAPETFKTLFHPFLCEQAAALKGGGSLSGARYSVQQGDAQFCFFDAYDRESLGWLEAVLARRTARHCLVVVHPPVVPYGARATWHVFSSEREKTQRERLLELLGKHRVIVLSGHIHKFNLLVRTTPQGGKFLQLGLSSVIPAPEVQPQHVLSGIASYNPDQVTVEPNFSPGTEAQRRAVYETEAPFVTRFDYADLPGYGVITINGPKATARIYSGVGRKLWRTLDLSQILEA